MTFRIVTINLYRYYDWQQRLPLIIEYLERTRPDVIAFQEVQLNVSFSLLPQSKQIADTLSYPYHVFAATDSKHQQLGALGSKVDDVSHGLAILSNFSILNIESIMLNRSAPDKEQRSIMLGEVEVDGKRVSIMNVHFNNNDDDARLHLKEAVALCVQRNVQPIILGDFNMYSLGSSDLSPLHYTISSENYEYQSYPADQSSLDYIAIPQKYAFRAFECSNILLSDHRPLLAEIQLVNQ